MFKKLSLGAAALVLGLAVAGEARAAGPGPGHFHHGGHGRPYYAHAGVKFKGGYYYRGHHHDHWRGRVWSPRHGCYHYWDPYLRCYYYWYAPQNCYVPVGVPVPF